MATEIGDQQHSDADMAGVGVEHIDETQQQPESPSAAQTRLEEVVPELISLMRTQNELLDKIRGLNQPASPSPGSSNNQSSRPGVSTAQKVELKEGVWTSINAFLRYSISSSTKNARQDLSFEDNVVLNQAYKTCENVSDTTTWSAQRQKGDQGKSHTPENENDGFIFLRVSGRNRI